MSPNNIYNPKTIFFVEIPRQVVLADHVQFNVSKSFIMNSIGDIYSTIDKYIKYKNKKRKLNRNTKIDGRWCCLSIIIVVDVRKRAPPNRITASFNEEASGADFFIFYFYFSRNFS